MTNRIHVAPAAGKSPRSPLPPYAPIPAEGIVTEDSSAWRRAEKYGDVVITPDTPAKAGKSK